MGRRAAGRRAAARGARTAGRRTARRRTRRRTRRRVRRRRLILVGGMMVWGSHKLRQRDVEQIEEYSGQPVDEMTDEEIDQAISDLDIQPEELNEEDEAYLAEQEGKGSREPDHLDELERLGHLRDEGYVTDEEFEMKKRQLLGL